MHEDLETFLNMLDSANIRYEVDEKTQFPNTKMIYILKYNERKARDVVVSSFLFDYNNGKLINVF